MECQARPAAAVVVEQDAAAEVSDASARECESSLKSTADEEEEEEEEGDSGRRAANGNASPEAGPAAAAAAVVERRNSVRLLRPREYSLNDAEDPEQTLFYAAQMGYTSAVSRLCTRYRASISPAALRHALSIAARQGHAALVSILLEAGADPDVADSEGWTPLRASAWGGHASAVQVLLERGALVDASDSEGRTALRAAAWAGHEEVVRALLNAGARVDGEDKQGRTPLIAAAYMGHADIVAALLDAGAQPDHVDCEGRTALSVAVLSVACRVTEQAARRSRRPRTVSTGQRMMKRRPSKVDSENPGASPMANDSAGAADANLRGPVPPSESSAPGTLSGTLDGDDYEAVETVTILLEYGASVNHQDKEGMTPLLVAAFEGHRYGSHLFFSTAVTLFVLNGL